MSTNPTIEVLPEYLKTPEFEGFKADLLVKVLEILRLVKFSTTTLFV